MRTIIGIIAVAALMGGAWLTAQHTEKLAEKYAQEGSGGGQPSRVNINSHGNDLEPPPEQQEVKSGFGRPRVKEENGKLVPTDPEERRKSELGIEFRDISDAAYAAVWIVPVVGLLLVAFLSRQLAVAVLVVFLLLGAGSWKASKYSAETATALERQAAGIPHPELQPPSRDLPPKGKKDPVSSKVGGGNPFKRDKQTNKLVPVNPVRREAGESSKVYRDIERYADYGVVGFPLLGVFLSVLTWKRRGIPQQEEKPHEQRASDPRLCAAGSDAPPGDAGSGPASRQAEGDTGPVLPDDPGRDRGIRPPARADGTAEQPLEAKQELKP